MNNSNAIKEHLDIHSRTSVLSVFLAVFFDMLAFALIIPVAAPLFFSEQDAFLGNAESTTRALLYGIGVAGFSLMQFFSLPILGAFADSRGRKLVLQLSLLGEAVAYVLAAVAIQQAMPILFILARILSGSVSAVTTIGYATLADISTNATKARNFGLVGAAFGLAFIIGPPLGGFFSNPQQSEYFSFSTPFYMAAVVSLFNGMASFLYFRETLPINTTVQFSIFQGMQYIAKTWQSVAFRRIFLGVFFAAFGFTFFTQFFQVFLLQKFSFNQQDIGKLFGYLGLWIVFSQTGLLRLLVKYFYAGTIVFVALPLLALSVLWLLGIENSVLLYVIVPCIALAQGVALPSMNVLVSNTASAHEQGGTVGSGQSVQALAQGIPPLIGGMVVAYGEGYPLLLSVFFTIIAWWSISPFRSETRISDHQK